MASRRARTGRGWDAAPPRPRRAAGRAVKPVRAVHDRDSVGSRAAGPELVDERRPNPAETAREICLRLLAVRPRTRSELAVALRRRGISDEIAAQVLDRYGEVGMIDDAAFARAWVTSRHHGRGLARRALAGELRQRGVESEIVSEALGEVDGDTEAATARALVDRKLRTVSGSPESVFRRLVALLARKGYPAGLAFHVVKDALAEREDTSEFAELLDPDSLADGVEDARTE